MTKSQDIELAPTDSPAAHPPPLPPARAPRRLNIFFDRILTIVFLLALLIPTLGTFFQWDPLRSGSEKRKLADWPRLPHSVREFNRYTDRASDWFRDHFGFRQSFIHLIKTAQFRTIGPTHNPDVIIGTEGWLYLRRKPDTGPLDMSFTLERGLLPFTTAEMESWRLILEKRQAYLAARGIPFFVHIAPDKQAIYPEYLPDILKNPPPPPTRLDQFLAYMKEKKSPVFILDLRAELIAAKSTGRIYWKTDTHWNYDGAYLAYARILEEINRRLPPNRAVKVLPRANLKHVDLGLQAGDLSMLLNLGDQLQEPWPTLQASLPFRTKLVPASGEGGHETIGSDPAAPRLLMYRDSFATALFSMTAQHFSYALFVWDDKFTTDIINDAKPDIVVNEFVERKLYWRLPEDSQEISDTPLPPDRNVAAGQRP